MQESSEIKNYTNKSKVNNNYWNLMRDKLKNNQKFYGIEISSKSNKLLNFNGFQTKPSFISLVWDNFSDSTIQTLNTIKSNGEFIGVVHLSCYQMTSEKLNQILEMSNSSNNFLVIRGDSVAEDQEFKYASDMVKKLKQIKKDSISIGVCGYPDIHPQAKSLIEDIQILKFKVDCGADFIITQLCFSSERILNFIKNCRSTGILQPIISGIFVPSTWFDMEKMLKITKIPIEDDLLKQFEQFKNDDEGFKEFSTNFFKNIVKDLIVNEELNCNGVHFFTLNHFDVAQRIVNDLF